MQRKIFKYDENVVTPREKQTCRAFGKARLGDAIWGGTRPQSRITIASFVHGSYKWNVIQNALHEIQWSDLEFNRINYAYSTYRV